MVPDPISSFAPGRVNLIGEHTDYNQGLALPFAITEGVTVRASALPGRRIEAAALDFDEEDRFDLDSPERAPGWRAFVRGATAELVGAGFELRGARLEIAGTVPRGSGLASSGALSVATSRPSMSRRPLVGRSSAPNRCIRVDLPQPLGPMMAT